MSKNALSISERAYRDLLGTLGKVADVVTGPMGATNARERAEGFRHLLRLLSVWLENILEKGDRAHPVFTRWINPTRKLLGDNPHTYYDAAFIDPKLTYRISGKRGMPTYLGFCVYGTAENGQRSIVSRRESDGKPGTGTSGGPHWILNPKENALPGSPRPCPPTTHF